MEARRPLSILRNRYCQHANTDSETGDGDGRQMKDIVDFMACMGEERLPRRAALGEMIRDKGHYEGQERDWIRDPGEVIKAAGTFSSPSPVFLQYRL